MAAIPHAILAIALLSTASRAENVITHSPLARDDVYLRCPRGSVHDNHTLDTFRTRSTLDCAVRCSMTEGCEGVNVCPAEDRPDMAVCTLMGGGDSAGCEDLVTAALPDCFFMQKEAFNDSETTTLPLTEPATYPQPTSDNTTLQSVSESTSPTSAQFSSTKSPTTVQMVCKNGGTPLMDGRRCLCPMQYAGATCNRYVRDCREAIESSGLVNSWQYLYIQPVSAPQPFLILCSTTYGNADVFLSHTTLMSFNLSWETAKHGYWNTTSDFFIGLENLRHLTARATYDMKVIAGNPFSSGTYFTRYSSLETDDESSSYILSYDFFPAPGFSKDGFGSSGLPFCTWDHDCHHNCAAIKGKAGWYDSNCDGYSPFGESLEWPDWSGTMQSVDGVQFRLMRVEGEIPGSK